MVSVVPDYAVPPMRVSLIARVLRGAALTGGSFVLMQALRFGSNLILARLLFPEAFGLMALLTMIVMGLTLLSDSGVQQSIMQHDRGDDLDFLNTAWTLNAVRGVVLWLLACALAWPAAQIYNAPELMAVLPVGALTLVCMGLAPTRVYTAQRHLQLGRITAIELGTQIVSISVMVLTAWATGSYWALVVGTLVAALLKLALEWTVLPGQRNRLAWERSAGRDLLRFGGWILLSSSCGFLILQGDRAFLGLYLSIEGLGIYTIAWFLASFPILLAQALVGRLLIPAYRESHLADNPRLHARIRWLRMYMTGGVWAMLGVLALLGPWLVGLLYDDRYVLAGAIMVLIAAAQMFPMVTMTYDQAALARGDSRRFFKLMALRAGLQTSMFVAGMMLAGLPGALAGQALSAVLAYPAMARMARDMDVWDKHHDMIFATLAALGTLGALSLHWGSLQALIAPF